MKKERAFYFPLIQGTMDLIVENALILDKCSGGDRMELGRPATGFPWLPVTGATGE